MTSERNADGETPSNKRGCDAEDSDRLRRRQRRPKRELRASRMQAAKAMVSIGSCGRVRKSQTVGIDGRCKQALEGTRFAK